MSGARALEIGCGRGVGIETILDAFEAAEVVAFDLDAELVALARRRTSHLKPKVAVFVGDATHIGQPDAAFDAVFDFGVIHQIERWRDAVAECARVLKPGGSFYFEAVSKPRFRAPMNLAMERGTADVRKIGFSEDSYLAALHEEGIDVGSGVVHPRSPITAAFVGDLIGVGTRKG